MGCYVFVIKGDNKDKVYRTDPTVHNCILTTGKLEIQGTSLLFVALLKQNAGVLFHICVLSENCLNQYAHWPFETQTAYKSHKNIPHI